MARGRKPRKRTKFKRKKKSRKPSQMMSRWFQYEPLLLGAPGIVQQPNIPTLSCLSFAHQLGNHDLADASLLSRYYAQYRIKKVALTIKVNADNIPQMTTAWDTVPAPSTFSNFEDCELLYVPWRDGVRLPSNFITEAVMEKMRSFKGAKSFKVPIKSLVKGFTFNYTPNTLTMGLEASAPTTPTVQGTTYLSKYSQWINNNDQNTEHFGYMVWVLQKGLVPLAVHITQSVLLQFKTYIIDPLLTVQNVSATNGTYLGTLTHGDPTENSTRIHSVTREALRTNNFKCRSLLLDIVADEVEAELLPVETINAVDIV